MMAKKRKSKSDLKKIADLCEFLDDDFKEVRDSPLEKINEELKKDRVNPQEVIAKVERRLEEIKRSEQNRGQPKKENFFARVLEQLRDFVNPKQPAFRFSAVFAALLVMVFTFKMIHWPTNGSATRGPDGFFSRRPQGKVERLNKKILEFYQKEQYKKAIPLSNKVLAIVEKEKGSDHPDTAAILNNQAVLYKRIGDYEESEFLYIRALMIQKIQLGADHKDTLETMNNLGLLYEKMEKNTEAEDIYKNVWAIQKKSLGPHHPKTRESMNNLFEFYRNIGADEKIRSFPRQ